MSTNSNPLHGPDKSVDLQTFHSTQRETFVIVQDLSKDAVSYFRETEVLAMEHTCKLD